jgi:hypothetical protein
VFILTGAIPVFADPPGEYILSPDDSIVIPCTQAGHLMTSTPSVFFALFAFQ